MNSNFLFTDVQPRPNGINATNVTEADFSLAGLVEVGQLLGQGLLSSQGLTQALLARIEHLEPRLNAFAHLMADDALTAARRADQELAAGLCRGPLHGVPIAVKDLCWVAGHPTSGGMRALRRLVPREDATVVHRLKAAGAVLIGKTQLTEGAYSDYHPDVPPVVNPWDAAQWAGVSSSGSAVATATGMCFGAIASDTGGSIRWPAAANGVTGLKPSWGRVSRHGVLALAPTLDHVGVMARSAVDCAALLGVIAGADPLDDTCLRMPVPDYLAATQQPIAGLRVGVDWAGHGALDAPTQAALQECADVLQTQGVVIVPVDWPDTTQVVADWTPHCAVEAAVAHSDWFDAHSDDYGPVLRGVVEHGRHVSAVAHEQILRRREVFHQQLAAVLAQVDVLLLPVQPRAAMSLRAIASLGEQPQLIADLQRFTAPLNMSGHPSLTLPAGQTESGLPVGVQLVARMHGEAALCQVGAAFQRATRWHRRHPPSWQVLDVTAPVTD